MSRTHLWLTSKDPLLSQLRYLSLTRRVAAGLELVDSSNAHWRIVRAGVSVLTGDTSKFEIVEVELDGEVERLS